MKIENFWIFFSILLIRISFEFELNTQIQKSASLVSFESHCGLKKDKEKKIFVAKYYIDDLLKIF